MYKSRFDQNVFHYELDLEYISSSNVPLQIECSFCFIRECYEYLEKNKLNFLSDIEINNLNKYDFRKKRHDYLLGRAAVKSILLKKQLKIRDFSILNKVTGKPFINFDKLDLSISHSGNSACAITYSNLLELAIDMEYIINVENNTNFHFCSSNEESLFLKQSHALNNQIIILINWCSKESLAKFIGTGFNIVYEILEIEAIRPIDQNILSICYKNIKSAKTIVLIFTHFIISITIPYSLNIKNIKSFFEYFCEYYSNSSSLL